MPRSEVTELRVIHDAIEYLFIAVHSIDKEPFEQAIQNGIRFCQSGTAPPNSCKSIVAECR